MVSISLNQAKLEFRLRPGQGYAPQRAHHNLVSTPGSHYSLWSQSAPPLQQDGSYTLTACHCRDTLAALVLPFNNA